VLRLLLFHASYCTLHLVHCIMLPLAHIQPFYALDQVQWEPESEVQAEQARTEAITNLAWMKASPSAFNQCPCLLF
jgi:hypothetical protein